MRLRTEHRSSVLPQIRFHGACVAQFETSLARPAAARNSQSSQHKDKSKVYSALGIRGLQTIL